MRRKEKEMTDPKLMDEIMNGSNLLSLAMADNDQPYVVIMNFAHQGMKVYLHSAQEGRKVDVLKKNSRVAFFIEKASHLTEASNACSYGMQYLSVYGEGRAVFVDEREEKIEALNLIMKKHTGKEGFLYSEAALEKTAVIRIDVSLLTGKRSS